MTDVISNENLELCLDFAEGKPYARINNIKNSDFPENLHDGHEDFYEIWMAFWKFIEPILDLEIYDVFYSLIGENAYFRYREAGITTVGDFISFCATHTKLEGNSILGDNSDKKYYKREICFEKIRELIRDKC